MGSTRVLVIGSGGREHALEWKLASERAVSDIVCAPGNAGISRIARCIPVDPADPHAVAAIARRELKGLEFSGVWLDVGTPERLAEARALTVRS